MANVTFTEVETYEILSCVGCNFKFACPISFFNWRRSDGKNFYCPSCRCQMSWTPGPTEAEKLRTELANVKRNLNWTEEQRVRNFNESEHQKRKAAAARGMVTKLKNKAAKGECPCCGQYFPDLHSHIETAHPEFVASKDNADETQVVEAINPDKPLSEQVEVPIGSQVRNARRVNGKVECPACKKLYKNGASLRSHMLYIHQGTSEQPATSTHGTETRTAAPEES